MALTQYWVNVSCLPGRRKLLCKAKREYLLTCKVSRYCLLTSHPKITELIHKVTFFCSFCCDWNEHHSNLCGLCAANIILVIFCGSQSRSQALVFHHYIWWHSHWCAFPWKSGYLSLHCKRSCHNISRAGSSTLNPLSAGVAYIRVFIFY